MLRPTIYIPSRLTKLLALLAFPPEITAPGRSQASGAARWWVSG